MEERQAGADLVLYDAAGGRLHVLNATAAAVWRMCDGSHAMPAIVGRIGSEFSVDTENSPESDVRALLRSFLEAGLIEDIAGKAVPDADSARRIN